MTKQITFAEYNNTNKLDLMREHSETKEKLASVCIPLGISGQEVRTLTPESLRLLVEGIIANGR